MSDTTKGLIAWAIILVAGIGVGLGIGWKLWSPKPGPVETYAPPVTQPDGSQILERKPQAEARPAQQVPKGAKVERVVQVVVQPNPPADPVSPLPSGSVASPADPVQSGPIAAQSGANPCPPVRVDLTLVRMQDQTRRVIASSPDGVVVGGVDIPVEPVLTQKTLKWAAGVVYGTTAWGDTARGAFLDRDLAFLRTGIEVTRNTYPLAAHEGWEFRAKLGIRF